MNYSSLIYAYDQQNIAVTGKGILDGQADNEHWWPWCGNPFYGGTRGEPNQVPGMKKTFSNGRKQCTGPGQDSRQREFSAAQFYSVL